MLTSPKDPTNEVRRAWLEQQIGAKRQRAPDALFVRGHKEKEEIAFMVAGDTGEGDGSQMAVVPGLLKIGQGPDFMVFCSDVIYPTGDANDYLGKFYWPYCEFPGPIYAIPGNHDWYDLLTGFMIHFCDAEPLPEAAPSEFFRSPRLWLRDRLWRKGAAPDPAIRAAGRCLRPPDPAFPPQRGPYWALDAGPIRIVAIDTGIRHCLDAEQGDWLCEVSKSPEPKILLTGSPIFVNGELHPCSVEDRSFTVQEIVENQKHNYIAAIGGDIHNYQRYPVRLPGGRTIQYIVCGGGGAFMHATYGIPNIDGQDDLKDVVSEESTHFFPARGLSLSELTNKLFRRRRLRRLRLTPEEAGALIGRHMELDPVTAEARARLGSRERFGMKLARRIFLERLPAPGRFFQRFASEFLDSDKPRMYKSFLRIDANQAEVRIRCFQATGLREDEISPPPEDEVVVPLPSPEKRPQRPLVPTGSPE